MLNSHDRYIEARRREGGEKGEARRSEAVAKEASVFVYHFFFLLSLLFCVWIHMYGYDKKLGSQLLYDFTIRPFDDG